MDRFDEQARAVYARWRVEAITDMQIVPMIAQALRAAHESGQRAMQERAAGVCETAGREAGKVDAIMASFDAAKAIRTLGVEHGS